MTGEAPGRDPPRVTPELARAHGLSAGEYERIGAILARVPTWEELGVFSLIWAEHCSYKSSRIHLSQLPTGGPRVVQGPGENAGAVDVGDGLVAVFKIESHSHPCAIEPYQGAATGVGGILRDVLAMGARPIASLNALRLGRTDHPRTPYLVQGVVAGIGGYGNCVGVPTIGGDLFFDGGYDRNVLVNVFTLGIARRDALVRARASEAGQVVFYVGAPTGRDGIHGASLLASCGLTSAAGSEERARVQVGDPFIEKLLLEACLEAVGQGAVAALQEMGAAGLTGSSMEMAARGGMGITLDLDVVPCREEGMTPYEILLSESQERMLLAAQRGREEEARAIFAKWDLEAVPVGRITAEGLFRARWRAAEVACIPVSALTADAPAYRRPAEEPPDMDAVQQLAVSGVTEPDDYASTLLDLMGSPNLASRAWVYRQYDQLVQANTVVRPGSDAAVVRVPGGRRALALSTDGNSRYCRLDPYVGAVIAVAEGARNVVCTGARPLALSGCLNFGSPEKPTVMWQFQQATAGIRDACLGLDIPVVSGNVSFYNETDGVPIPPTPVIAMVGLLDDAASAMTQWFKGEGDLVVLLGRTREEIGGSEYLAAIHHIVGGTPPWIDLEAERRLRRLCLTAHREGLLRSAHDVSDGGLAVALAECCISGPGEPVGARIEMEGGMRPDAWLFGESQSRVVVSARRRQLPRLRELARSFGVPCLVLGEVGGTSLDIGEIVEVPVGLLRERWRRGLERHLGSAEAVTA